MVIETRKLIGTVHKLYPVVEFLKNRYFPDGKTYYSEKALIETKKQGRKAAPFVIPVVGGIVMDGEGYRAYEVDAPYIAPKMPITAQELSKKAFGESPESGRTPEQRENEIQAEHMDDMRKAIYRRQELMCGEVIQTGKLTMKHYATAEDAAKDEKYETIQLQFFDESFQNSYSLEKDFMEMTAQEKLLIFYKMAAVLRERGVRATDLVMTSDVSMMLMTDKDFLDYYDKAKVATGIIDQHELPDGVVCNGNININGVVMTMFTYDVNYEDLNGEVKQIFQKGTIAMLHPNLGQTVYAQVTFVQGGGFKSYAQRIVPRVVADEKNNLMEVQMFSRPIPYPYDWESWLVANVYGTGGYAADIHTDSMFRGTADGIPIKSEEEILELSAKEELIAYAEAAGLGSLDESKSLDDLKAEVITLQEDVFED